MIQFLALISFIRLQYLFSMKLINEFGANEMRTSISFFDPKSILHKYVKEYKTYGLPHSGHEMG
jgi:hypothetical protein